jgi:biopolymer transport protein ExbB/TolQ
MVSVVIDCAWSVHVEDVTWTWPWLWSSTSLFTKALFLLLTVMFVHACGIFAERILKFKAAQRDGIRLSDFIDCPRSELTVEAAISYTNSGRKRPLTELVGSGLQAFRCLPLWLSDQEAIDLSQRAMRRCASLMNAKMKVGLSALTTIATLAPLVGLVGTTVGLLSSFRGGSGTPMSWLIFYCNSISLALLPTAVGLLVGIVAVALYNHLTIRLEGFNVVSGSLVVDVLSFVSARQNERGAVEADAGQLYANYRTTKEASHDAPTVLLVTVWTIWLYVFCFVLWAIVWNLMHPY